MTERDIIPKVMKYIRDELQMTCAVEIKLCKEKSMPFSALAEHQERALVLANGIGMYWKIADGSGQATPYDAFCLIGEKALVAIVWGKKLTLIPINDFIEYRNLSKRKSITFNQACQLSTYEVVAL